MAPLDGLAASFTKAVVPNDVLLEAPEEVVKVASAEVARLRAAFRLFTPTRPSHSDLAKLVSRPGIEPGTY